MNAEDYVSHNTLSGNSYEKCKIMTDGFWDCIQTLNIVGMSLNSLMSTGGMPICHLSPG